MWDTIVKAVAYPALLAYEFTKSNVISNVTDLVNVTTVANATHIDVNASTEDDFTQAYWNAGITIGLIALSAALTAWELRPIEGVEPDVSEEDIAEENVSIEVMGDGTASKMPVQTLYKAFIKKAEDCREVIPGLSATYTPNAEDYLGKQKQVLKHLGLPKNGDMPNDLKRFSEICIALKVPCSV